ncbi:MAG: hypothetical protein J1F35_06075 [Erysipelotrichales bacterium]|nr:hypothetical protein [Erysipelotrichales bacterium]
MMNNKIYQIQCRYEYWSIEHGKIWTKWFNVYGEVYHNKDLIESRLEDIKNKVTSIDKITKLKHEYQIVENIKENEN